MIKYYLTLKPVLDADGKPTTISSTTNGITTHSYVYESDAVGHVITGCYKANAPESVTDVVFCTRKSPLPAYDRLTESMTDWAQFAYSGGKIVASFKSLKEQKLAKIQNDYQAALDAGITVGGITLAATRDDQNMFGNYLSMLHTAEKLMTPEQITAFEASTQSISDRSHTAHGLTVMQIFQTLVGYGTTIQTLWATMATRRAAATAATTVAELNAI